MPLYSFEAVAAANVAAFALPFGRFVVGVATVEHSTTKAV